MFWKRKDAITRLAGFAGKFLSFAVSEFSPPAPLFPFGVSERANGWSGTTHKMHRFTIISERNKIDFDASNHAALAWADEERAQKSGLCFVAMSGTANFDGQEQEGLVTVASSMKDDLGIYSFIPVVGQGGRGDVRLLYPFSSFLKKAGDGDLLEENKIRQFNQAVRSAFASAPFQHSRTFVLWPAA